MAIADGIPAEFIDEVGSSTREHAAFKKSMNSFFDLSIISASAPYANVISDSFYLEPEGVRAFLNCFIKPFAIFPAAVPNSELTLPLATMNCVFESTTT